MRKALHYGVLLLVTSLCLSLSAQKPASNYKELFYEAGVLAQNSLYDVAEQYYFDALNQVPQGQQYKNIKNQIKEKIQLMECYQRFYHLWGQAQQLEQKEDFESAFKFYDDALDYADVEELEIPGKDSLRMRLRIVEQTADLCKSLCLIEMLNLEGDYEKARNQYMKWVEQADSYGYKWEKYQFPANFVQKVDSITGFLEDERNVILPYRTVFPDDYVVMDNYLFELLDKAACDNPHPVESDVTFVLSLDTNGIIEMYIDGNQANSPFNEQLLKAAQVKMTQPYRYGFSMPVKEEIRYHISSTKTSVWVEKSKKGYKVKDAKVKKQYMEEFRNMLADAPEGKYLFLIHRNVIDNKSLSSVRLTDAKGGKAKKWLKSR
jgi:hypothetical protein